MTRDNFTDVPGFLLPDSPLSDCHTRKGWLKAVDDKARKTRKGDEEDGAFTVTDGEDEDGEEDGDGGDEGAGERGGAKVVDGEEGEGGGGDEAEYGEAEGAEEGGHGGVVFMVLLPLAYDNDEGGGQQDDGEGGDEGAEEGHIGRVACRSDGGVADVGGGVDAYGTGGYLADSENVGKFCRSNPGMTGYHLVVDEGNHGVAATEGEESDEEEGVEELEEDHG